MAYTIGAEEVDFLLLIEKVFNKSERLATAQDKQFLHGVQDALRIAQLQFPADQIANDKDDLLYRAGQTAVWSLMQNGALKTSDGVKDFLSIINHAEFPIGSFFINNFLFDSEDNIRDFFSIIDHPDFPILDFIDYINISQQSWLPKLQSYAVEQGGVCGALNYMWSHRGRIKLYQFLAKIVLCPDGLLSSILDDELKLFSKLCRIIQHPEEFNAELNFISIGKISDYLKSESIRTFLGLQKVFGFVDFNKRDERKGVVTHFFSRQEFIDRIKIIPPGSEIAFHTMQHRMGFKIIKDKNDQIYCSFYDANEEHGDKEFHCIEDFYDAIVESCKRIHVDVSTYLPLGIRVYADGDNDNNAYINFNKEALVNEVIKKGEIDGVVEKNITRLMMAVRNNDEEMVALLLEAGADANICYDISSPHEAPNTKMLSPLGEAASHGYIDIVKLLLQHGAKLDAGTQAPFLCAAVGGRQHVVKYFVKHYRKEIESLIIPAINLLANQPKIQQMVLESQNEDGLTYLAEAIKDKNDQLMTKLLDLGAKVDTADVNGVTPLMRVVQQVGSLSYVKRLLDKTTDINMTDNEHKTVLMHAVLAGDADIIRCVLSKDKIDVTMKDIYEFTAAEYYALHSVTQGNYDDSIYQSLLPKEKQPVISPNVNNNADKDIQNDQQEEKQYLEDARLLISNVKLVGPLDGWSMFKNIKEKAVIESRKSKEVRTTNAVEDSSPRKIQRTRS